MRIHVELKNDKDKVKEIWETAGDDVRLIVRRTWFIEMVERALAEGLTLTITRGLTQ